MLQTRENMGPIINFYKLAPSRGYALLPGMLDLGWEVFHREFPLYSYETSHNTNFGVMNLAARLILHSEKRDID